MQNPTRILAALGAIVCSTVAVAQTSTETAVNAAHWGGNVTVTTDGNAMHYVSNGLPNHELAESYLIPVGREHPATSFEAVKSEGFVIESPIDVTIPLVPVYSETPTETSLGLIGVMISGAPLYNDYETPDKSIVAMDDQHEQDGVKFLDDCNGHPLQEGTSYHYHASPPCVTVTVDKTATAHSTMIGVLLDGFPIYGPQSENGMIVTNADLDACSGHLEATPEFPDGIYHYHLTTEEAPYSVDCYHGEVDASVSAQMGGPGGERPDFSAIAAQLGVTEHALTDALGAQRPPNFDAAAAALGISVDDLRAALPAPAGQ